MARRSFTSLACVIKLANVCVDTFLGLLLSSLYLGQTSTITRRLASAHLESAAREISIRCVAVAREAGPSLTGPRGIVDAVFSDSTCGYVYLLHSKRDSHLPELSRYLNEFPEFGIKIVLEDGRSRRLQVIVRVLV